MKREDHIRSPSPDTAGDAMIIVAIILGGPLAFIITLWWLAY